MGVLSLAKTNNAEDLNHACRRALNYNRVSYREIKLYLEALIRQREESQGDQQIIPFITHNNLRDKALYK